MQAFNLDIVQPMIRNNAHAWYEGTATWHRPSDKFVHEVETVEVMAPCYSQNYWSSCLWPLLNPQHSSGWGVDLHLHRIDCAPNNQYSIRLPMDHEDRKSYSSNSAGQEQEMNEVKELVESMGILRSDLPREQFNSYSVYVNEDCQLQLTNATAIQRSKPKKTKKRKKRHH